MGRAAQYAEGAGRKLEKQRSLLVNGVTNAMLSIYVHICFSVLLHCRPGRLEKCSASVISMDSEFGFFVDPRTVGRFCAYLVPSSV